MNSSNPTPTQTLAPAAPAAPTAGQQPQGQPQEAPLPFADEAHQANQVRSDGAPSSLDYADVRRLFPVRMVGGAERLLKVMHSTLPLDLPTWRAIARAYMGSHSTHAPSSPRWVLTEPGGEIVAIQCPVSARWMPLIGPRQVSFVARGTTITGKRRWSSRPYFIDRLLRQLGKKMHELTIDDLPQSYLAQGFPTLRELIAYLLSEGAGEVWVAKELAALPEGHLADDWLRDTLPQYAHADRVLIPSRSLVCITSVEAWDALVSLTSQPQSQPQPQPQSQPQPQPTEGGHAD